MSPNKNIDFEEKIYQKYYSLVYSTCKRRLYDQGTLEDGIQATFLMFVREEKNIRSSLSSWFYWAAINVCQAINKGIKKQQELEKSNLYDKKSSLMNKSPVDEESFIKVDKILGILPKKKQEMLVMRFFDGLSYRQIALQSGGSEEGVRKTIERTLKHLSENLNKKDVYVSALITEFFQKSPEVAMASASVGAKSQSFVLQNTVTQQLIVKSVQTKIFMSKLFLTFAVTAGLSLPIVSFVLATKSNNTIEKIETTNSNEKPKNKIEKGKEKDIAAIEPANKVPVVEQKPKEEIKEEVANAKGLIGNWTLSSKSGSYPHAIGSVLKIDNQGAFSLTQPNAAGKHTETDSAFNFDFGGGMIFSFTYNISGETLSFKGTNNAMQLIYTKHK